jgi:hypothetical protein
MQFGATGMSVDPTCTDSDKYVSIVENEWVRVLDYRDLPGQHTQPHHHPNSVMITLSDFRRRLAANGKTAEVDMTAGRRRGSPRKPIRATTSATPTRT